MSKINPGESGSRNYEKSQKLGAGLWISRFTRLTIIVPSLLVTLAGCPADFETDEGNQQSPTATPESEKDLPRSTSAINYESYFTRSEDGHGRAVFTKFIGEYYLKNTPPQLREVEDTLIQTVISFDSSLSISEMERIMAIFAYEGILLNDPNLNPILAQIQNKAVRGEYANIINAHIQNQGIEPVAPIGQPRESGHLSDWADKIWPKRVKSINPEGNSFFRGDYVALSNKLPPSDTPGLTFGQRNLLIAIEEEIRFLLDYREKATVLDKTDPKFIYNINHAERGLFDALHTLALNHPDLAFPDAATKQEYYRTREELYKTWLELNNLFIQLANVGNDEVHSASLKLSIQTAAGVYVSRFDQAINLYPLSITTPDNLHPEVRAKIEQQLFQIRQQQRQYYIERLGNKTAEIAANLIGNEVGEGVRLVLTDQRQDSSKATNS